MEIETHFNDFLSSLKLSLSKDKVMQNSKIPVSIWYSSPSLTFLLFML